MTKLLISNIWHFRNSKLQQKASYCALVVIAEYQDESTSKSWEAIVCIWSIFVTASNQEEITSKSSEAIVCIQSIVVMASYQDESTSKSWEANAQPTYTWTGAGLAALYYIILQGPTQYNLKFQLWSGNIHMPFGPLFLAPAQACSKLSWWKRTFMTLL